eukprot:m51a1_g10563 hypothetical protein (433) ;mRNA; f:13190-14991
MPVATLDCCCLLGALAALAASSPSSPYYVLLTDSHNDQLYAEGSPSTCPSGLCCHADTLGNGTAGKYGEESCEASPTLLAELLAETSKMYPDPDLILYTGDTVPHGNQDYPTVLRNWEYLMSNIRANWPGVPFYPVFGNHEAQPVWLLEPVPGQPIVRNITALWRSYGYVDGEEPAATASEWGYYTALHRQGHRIVGVNSVWNLLNNRLVNDSDPDPAGQKAWLASVLAAARGAGERVWVLAHACPGQWSAHDSLSKGDWTPFFAEQVHGNPGVVARQYCGHTHRDHFLLVRDRLGAAAELVSLVTPQTSTNGGSWPTVRVGFYDSQTLEETELYTYHVDWRASNAARKVVLEVAYEMREAYGMKDLSASSFDDLALRLLKEEDTASVYLQRKAGSGDAIRAPCNETCRTDLFCTIAYPTLDLQAQCMQTPY